MMRARLRPTVHIASMNKNFKARRGEGSKVQILSAKAQRGRLVPNSAQSTNDQTEEQNVRPDCTVQRCNEMKPGLGD